jgi:hypothetical protein
MTEAIYQSAPLASPFSLEITTHFTAADSFGSGRTVILPDVLTLTIYNDQTYHLTLPNGVDRRQVGFPHLRRGGTNQVRIDHSATQGLVVYVNEEVLFRSK